MNSVLRRNLMNPLLILSYEPDPSLLPFLKEASGIFPVLLLDMGSGPETGSLLHQAEQLLGSEGVFRKMESCPGIGAALKEGFRLSRQFWPQQTGTITMDASILYSLPDILKVSAALDAHPDSLILGSRDFSDPAIPAGTRRGNGLTAFTYEKVTGHPIGDTQTHLRGVPAAFQEELLKLRENHFDFETRMLVSALESAPVLEVTVAPPVKSEKRRKGYYHPVSDSVRMYWVLLGRLAKYALTSIGSSVIDLILFTVFCRLFHSRMPALYITLSTLLARLVSATINYILNYIIVFRSQASVAGSFFRYWIVCGLQILASAGLVSLFHLFFPVASETGFKILVDTCLFFVCFWIQKKFVYHSDVIQDSL